jgi:hypothetical protein
VDWTVLTYRMPAEPSRHRVAVWRELRRAGAVSLQQATWALPHRPDFAEVLTKVVGLVEAADGDALVFDSAPKDDRTAARVEEIFTGRREEEWGEFLSECAKFDAEIAKEIRIRKFTAAELDEEEQNLERLHRWFRELRRRDVFVAPSQAEAERRLKECDARLEEFAARVYDQGGNA